LLNRAVFFQAVFLLDLAAYGQEWSVGPSFALFVCRCLFFSHLLHAVPPAGATATGPKTRHCVLCL